MKKDDIIDSLEYVEDEFLEEADRTRQVPEPEKHSEKITPIRKKRVSAGRWGTLAASLAVLAVAAFVIAQVLGTRSGSMGTMQSEKVAEVEETAAESTDMAEETAAESADMAEEAPTESVEMEEEAPAESMEMAEEAPAESAEIAESAGAAREEYDTNKAAAVPEESVRICVSSDAGEVIFALNDTPAAKSLLAQLPLSVDTEPYSDNEIIFYPDEPLDTAEGLEGGGTAGYLGYFAPWNDVVMYYGDFSEYPGLYILGEAVSGAENIRNIQGRVTISEAGS